MILVTNLGLTLVFSNQLTIKNNNNNSLTILYPRRVVKAAVNNPIL